AAAAALVYAKDHYWNQPYHTSILTGHGWVQELIHGHPDRIYTELGISLHVFLILVAQLRALGTVDSRKGITVEEQVAIFLY
ncbi:hypothetical protein CPB85DRAFT_1152061, partial [Mucidula mucida]